MSVVTKRMYSSSITQVVRRLQNSAVLSINQRNPQSNIHINRTMSTSTITAIRVHKTGDASVLQLDSDIPVPQIKENEVLVQIAYAGINFIDTYQRSGLYPLQTPFTLGREGSGIVTQVGSAVKNIKQGDRVVFMSQGTYATYTVVPEKDIIHVPSSVTLKDAAAAILQGLTAHYLTHSTYPLKSGDTALVHAAAGGTGALVVEMAKLRGATVIGTAGSDSKVELVKSLKADHVINYSTSEFLTEVKKYTSDKGVNVVYDGVGKATWENSMKSLAKLGYLVLFGNASGAVPPIDPLLLSRHGSLFVTRPTLFDYILAPGSLKQRSDDLFKYIANKQVTIRIGKVFKLSEAADAQRYLESRQSTGKVLLAVDENLK